MIAIPIIKAIAFPWLLIDEGNRVVDNGDGSLFRQPEARVDGVLAKLGEISDSGWGRCAAGFAIYKFTTESISPFHVVLYGMKINGVSTAQGRSEGLSVRMDQEHLKQYVAEYCQGVEALDDSYRSLIRENIHEIRGINSGLYNTAYQLDGDLQVDHSSQNLSNLSKSVVRWSELLSGRIDFMEFIANPNAASAPKVEISVYKKFDKVQRCFRVTANRNSISLSMRGASNATVYGPPIFDIIPFLLLDNAVKYSPPNKPIEIICNESNNYIFCRVTSTGPKIEDGELEQIFVTAVRGKNAIRSGKAGSGLGLPVLNRIVKNVFGGSIEVSQKNTYLQIGSIPYSEISFEIKLPISRHS